MAKLKHRVPPRLGRALSRTLNDVYDEQPYRAAIRRVLDHSLLSRGMPLHTWLQNIHDARRSRDQILAEELDANT